MALVSKLRAGACVLLIAGALLLRPDAGSAQTPNTLQPLRVIVLPLEIAAAAYYAEDLHFFARVGLDVTIQSLLNGGFITAAVVSGAADIGSSNPVSLEIAHDKGLPVTILAGASFQDAKAPTNGLLSVASSSSIHSAKDLNGKTIAISGLGNITDLGVRNWIDQNGGDSSTLKFIESSIPAMTANLLAGRVDAGALDASNFNAAPKGQLRLIGSVFNSFGPLWVQSAWFTSKDFAAKHPDTAKKFITAIRMASVWANAHPKEAIQIFAKYTKYTVPELEDAVRPPFVTKPVTSAQLQTTINVAAKYGYIKTAFPGSELLSPLNDEP